MLKPRLTTMPSPYLIRDAVPSDADQIVAFTLAEAREAERYEASPSAVHSAVLAALRDASLARYWVVDCSGEPVASTSVVTEWSNFRNGHYWWVQSFFIAAAHRGRGLVELMLNHVMAEAQAAGALELRLYAHTTNARAIRAYERCGFTAAPYVMMRRLQ